MAMAGADVPLHTQYMAMAGAGGVRERVCLYCTAFGTRVYLLAVALTPGVFSSVSVKSCPAKSVSGNTLHVAAASGRSSSTAHVRIAKRFEVGGGSRRGRQSCRDDFEQLWTHFLFTLPPKPAAIVMRLLFVSLACFSSDTTTAPFPPTHPDTQGRGRVGGVGWVA